MVDSKTMTFTGPMLVYFNRHGAAPRVWCVSAITGWELCVTDVVISGCVVTTVYAPKATPDEDDGIPSAYLSVTGVLTVDSHGRALISPPKDLG
jgi:hypothetical protein